jgi:hypothetical protein
MPVVLGTWRPAPRGRQSECKSGVGGAVASVVTATFGAASAAILGLAAAGVAASSMGQLLSFQMDRLSRTVAGLFTPEINRVIGLITRLTNWIESLTNTQKKMIAYFTLAAAGITLAAGVSVVLIGVLANLAQVINLIGAELTIWTGGLFLIVAAVGAVVAAIGGWLALTESGNKTLGAMWEWLSKLWTKLTDALSPAFDALAQVLSQVIDWIGQLVDMGGELASAFGEALVSGINEVVQIFALLFQIFKGQGDVFIWLVRVTITPLIVALKLLAWWMNVVAQSAKAVREFLFGKTPEVKFGDKEQRDTAPKQLGGIEGIDAVWKRMAEASRLVGGQQGKPVEEQQLDEQKTTSALV